MTPKVAVILVKYNRPDMEEATIRTVMETAQHPNYTLIAHQNDRGIGLAECWNNLIRGAYSGGAEYICLLNTDTVPTPGWLLNLTGVLNTDPTIDAVVPSSNRVHLSEIKVPFPDSETDRPRINAFAAGFTDFELRDLPAASAMCVVFRVDAWLLLGGFDEDFFLYGEDTDFFYRLAKNPLTGRVVWHTGVYVHHYGQQSMVKAEEDGEIEYVALRREAEQRWKTKKEQIDARYNED